MCVLVGVVVADDDDYSYVIPANYRIPSTYNFGAIPGPVFPYAYTIPVNPIIQPGYVAQTRGSEHRAPLPAAIGYASHHINIAPAPGTKQSYDSSDEY